MSDSCDVLVAGAGPAGLCLAAALAGDGLDVTVVERLPRAALAAPPPDGRDIALTHRAVDILLSLGCWQRYPAADISPIREARVVDGRATTGLHFRVDGTGAEALGYLVPNHVIREAAFNAALSQPRVRLIDGQGVEDVEVGGQSVTARLADGQSIRARLFSAADSRFSQTRRRLGIGAEMRDFGRTIIVCRMHIERPHEGVAHECFHYGHTLAVLPLNGNLASIVITVSPAHADELMCMSPEAFDVQVTDWFEARFGEMHLTGDRHAYPLVAVYAHRFSGHRCVLVGDTAVGMHPVTAHGFNFGLYGVDTLRSVIAGARRQQRDPGEATVLREYDRRHRRTTRPVYVGTNLVVQLFTDDRRPARLLREGVLRIANRLPPLKAGITRLLTGKASAEARSLSPDVRTQTEVTIPGNPRAS